MMKPVTVLIRRKASGCLAHPSFSSSSLENHYGTGEQPAVKARAQIYLKAERRLRFCP
jgi:hypothetical protein